MSYSLRTAFVVTDYWIRPAHIQAGAQYNLLYLQHISGECGLGQHKQYVCFY